MSVVTEDEDENVKLCLLCLFVCVYRALGTHAEPPVYVPEYDTKLRELHSFWAVTTVSLDTNSRIFDNSTSPTLPRLLEGLRRITKSIRIVSLKAENRN